MKNAICRFTLLIGLVGVSSVARADREKLLYETPQEKVAWQKRTRQFGQVWLSRHQHPVTEQMLTMLREEPEAVLREHIVMALGRLEDPAAIPALQVLLEKSEKAEQERRDLHQQIPSVRIRLALGRIQSRDLKGVAKLDGIAASVGTDWAGVQEQARQLKQSLANAVTYPTARESTSYDIVEEFYDILYRMGKGGEDIRQLGAFNLVMWSDETSNVAAGINSQEQTKLLAASLTDSAEIDFWLQRSMPPSTAWLYPGHLLDLGPGGTVELKKYLKELLVKVKENPSIVEKTRSYKNVFAAAVATDDKDFIPILSEFKKVGDRWVKFSAEDALKDLQAKTGLAAVGFP